MANNFINERDVRQKQQDLLDAVKKGDLATAKALIEDGVDFTKVRDENRKTLLMLVVEKGEIDDTHTLKIMEYLINKCQILGIDVNSFIDECDNAGKTALHYAVWHWKYKTCDFLIKKCSVKSFAKASVPSGSTPLHYAARHIKESKFVYDLDKSARLFYAILEAYPKAIEMKDNEEVKKAPYEYFDINQFMFYRLEFPDDYKYVHASICKTILAMAIDENKTDLVKVLVDFGNVDVKCFGRCGARIVDYKTTKYNEVELIYPVATNPIFSVACEHKFEILKILVEKGFDVNEPERIVEKDGKIRFSEKTLLHCVLTGDIKPEHDFRPCLEYLLSKGARCDGHDFYAAIIIGRIDIAKKILGRLEEQINEEYKGKITAIEVVNEIKEIINSVRIKVGCSILMSVIHEKFDDEQIRLGIINYLLELGIDATVKSSSFDEETALHYAVRDGKTEVVTMLLNHNHDLIDIKDKNGKTALHYAVEFGKLDIIKILLNNYADISAVDNKNKIPLDYVKEISDQRLKAEIEEIFNSRFALRF